MKKSEKFLIVYVREEKDNPEKFNVFFSEDTDLDSYRNKIPLSKHKAIEFAEMLLREEANGVGEIILEYRNQRAELLFKKNRNNY